MPKIFSTCFLKNCSRFLTVKCIFRHHIGKNYVYSRLAILARRHLRLLYSCFMGNPVLSLYCSSSGMSIDGSFNSCHIAHCGRALFCKRSHYESTLCIKYLLCYKGKHCFFLVARKNVCLGRTDRRTKGQ